MAEARPWPIRRALDQSTGGHHRDGCGFPGLKIETWGTHGCNSVGMFKTWATRPQTRYEEVAATCAMLARKVCSWTPRRRREHGLLSRGKETAGEPDLLGDSPEAQEQ